MNIKLFAPLLCFFLISCGSDKETNEVLDSQQTNESSTNEVSTVVFKGSSKSKGDFEFDDLISRAKLGDTNAMVLLALKYKTGDGVKKDLTLAEQWVRKAADLGDSIAQDNLGVMYRDGEGVDKNPEKAVNWFTLSAKQGNEEAQGNLGQMYLNGTGTKQDFYLAFAWSKLAVQNGNDSFARNNMALAEKYLNKEQLLDASAQANSWKTDQVFISPKPPADPPSPNAKPAPSVVVEPKN